MQLDRQTRRRLRREADVVVRVRCDRCHRVLGELYGSLEEPSTFSTPKAEGMFPWGARIDDFHCRCLPAPYIVRWAKLAAAYHTAANRSSGDRDLWLLADVRGV